MVLCVWLCFSVIYRYVCWNVLVLFMLMLLVMFCGVLCAGVLWFDVALCCSCFVILCMLFVSARLLVLACYRVVVCCFVRVGLFCAVCCFWVV